MKLWKPIKGGNNKHLFEIFESVQSGKTSSAELSTQNELGTFFSRVQGEGGVLNYHKAVEWFEKSARQGDSYAQEQLATIFLKGQGGIPKNYAEGYFWALMAAKTNNPADIQRRATLDKEASYAAQQLSHQQILDAHDRAERLAKDFSKQ